MAAKDFVPDLGILPGKIEHWAQELRWKPRKMQFWRVWWDGYGTGILACKAELPLRAPDQYIQSRVTDHSFYSRF
jgi:hypothetical protein